jgi:hypothetical protein
MPLRYLTERLEPVVIYSSTDPQVIGAFSKLACTACSFNKSPEPDDPDTEDNMDAEDGDGDEELKKASKVRTPKTLSRAIKPAEASTSTPATMALRSLDNSFVAAISCEWSETLTHAIVITQRHHARTTGTIILTVYDCRS